MAKAWIENIKKIIYIAEKDIKIYFFKGPNLTFGLLLPVILYLAFAIGRTVELSLAIHGLVAMAAFFGAGAIQAISLPLEKRTGTFNMFLTAPLSLSAIILGKALAGFFFGTVLSLAYTAIMMPFLRYQICPYFSSASCSLPLHFLRLGYSSLRLSETSHKQCLLQQSCALRWSFCVVHSHQ